tara:strand:+ start:3456 stop:4499 length:1044 start_codon:yes stop_codon:yes gene_type:complete
MYVAPRPRLEDDPYFAIRLALLCVISFVAVQWIKPVFPVLVVALPVGLLAAQRKRFDPKLAIGAAVFFIAVVWAMTLLVELTRETPVLMLVLAFAVFTIGFYVVRRTGSPIGMLVVIAAALMSIMALKSPQLLFYFRDGFTQGALLGAVVIPVLYWMIPPATNAQNIMAPQLADGHHGAASLIRASVLMLLSFWLYAVMPASDMLLAFGAIYVLVFPTGKQAITEAKERSLATLYGTIAALIVLTGVAWIGHFAVLLGLIALVGLFFGSRMIDGYHPSMVYQYALSVAVALVATALSTQSPAYAAVMRILLTSTGAIAAAVLVAILDILFLSRKAEMPAALPKRSNN